MSAQRVWSVLVRRQAMLHPPSHAQRPPLILSPHRPPVTPPACAPVRPRHLTQAYFLLRGPRLSQKSTVLLSLQKGDRASLGPSTRSCPGLEGWPGLAGEGLRGGGPKPSVSHSRSRWPEGLGGLDPRPQEPQPWATWLPLSRPERPARPSDVLGGPPRGFGSAQAASRAQRSLSPLRFLLTPLSLQITASP